MSQPALVMSRAQPDMGRWVLSATILASAMAFIDGTALNVALPAIQSSLRATGAQLLWVVNAYLLMLAALILVGVARRQTGPQTGVHDGHRLIYAGLNRLSGWRRPLNF